MVRDAFHNKNREHVQMSVFSSESQWSKKSPACAGPNQSPIALSESSAKPCSVACDFTFDDGYVSNGIVMVTDDGLVLVSSTAGLGTCKYKGETYTCSHIFVNHPSHHTIESMQGDGECIAFCRTATGKILCVSALFRANPTHSPSYNFFKQFVGYGDPTSKTGTSVMLNDWSLFMMAPPASPYFVYTGSTVAPPCAPNVEWVVFKNMINMDVTDFASLVRNNKPGFREIQATGDREVFFNDTENLPGGPMPHDNKTYMRCKPTGKKNGGFKTVSKADLKSTKSKELADSKEEAENPSTLHGKLKKHIQDYALENGIIGVLGVILTLVAISAGWYYGSTYGKIEEYSLIMPWLGQQAGRYLKPLLFFFLYWTIGWFLWPFGMSVILKPVWDDYSLSGYKTVPLI